MGNKGAHAFVAGSGEFDSISDALGHRERRRLLVELYDNDTLDYRESVGDMGEGRTDAELQLVHMHLPKLDDMGYIAWDRDSGESKVESDRTRYSIIRQ
jgi:hypothetical protein